MRGAALALLLLFAAPLACGSRERSKIGVPSDTAGDSESLAEANAPEEAQGGASGDTASLNEAPGAPALDPKTEKLALERASEAGSVERPYGLAFELIEQGPELPWAFVVANQGTEPVEVVVDPRLLRLELEIPPPEPEPGKKAPAKPPKPQTLKCELPEGIRPAKPDKRLLVRLEPEQYVVELFDPRLYCLPSGGKSPLDAEVKVTPRFGWPLKTKTVWRKGKREEEVLPQVAPFVATPLPSSEAGTPSEAKSENATDAGVKELVGTTLTLGEDYRYRPPPPAPGPLELVLVRGSDATSEETATITVRLKNISKERQQVFFRRELLSFIVNGPDGMVLCDPQPEGRVPDKLAFKTIAPGGAIEATSRLIELCPDDTFARPGLYLAHARFSSRLSGEEFGIEAVTGDFTSAQPVVIRIRTGDLPFVKGPPVVRSRGENAKRAQAPTSPEE